MGAAASRGTGSGGAEPCLAVKLGVNVFGECREVEGSK